MNVQYSGKKKHFRCLYKVDLYAKMTGILDGKTTKVVFRKQTASYEAFHRITMDHHDRKIA